MSGIQTTTMRAAASLEDSPRNERRSAARQLSKVVMSALLPRRIFLVRGPARSKAIGLTFDDGPHPVNTPRLLDVLGELNVKATFFLLGRNVEAHPQVVRRIADDGHAIGHHTFDHSRLDEISTREMLSQLDRTDELFERIIGRQVRLFRPPRGKVTAGKLVSLWRRGYGVMLWTVDPKDCRRTSREELAGWFKSNAVGAGDVVLMHDDHPWGAEALPGLVADARQRGLEFVTAAQWMS